MSHFSAASPRTIAAVAAVLASTHDPATTVAVRHGPRAGSPVVGSMMWCSSMLPRVQRRTVVLEVATAPPRSAITSPSVSAAIALSSATRTGHPSGGTSPAVAMSPPSDTRTAPPRIARCALAAARSAAKALPVDPRSSSTPGGRAMVRLSRSKRMLRQPGTGSTRKVSGPALRARRGKSSSYPTTRIALPTVGSTAPSLSRAARRDAATASANRALTATGRPWCAFTVASSLSGRKRLYARSTARSVSLTAVEAGPSAAAPLTSTCTDVPSARQPVVAIFITIESAALILSEPLRLSAVRRGDPRRAGGGRGVDRFRSRRHAPGHRARDQQQAHGVDGEHPRRR